MFLFWCQNPTFFEFAQNFVGAQGDCFAAKVE